jgi:hypothetical protein
MFLCSKRNGSFAVSLLIVTGSKRNVVRDRFLSSINEQGDGSHEDHAHLLATAELPENSGRRDNGPLAQGPNKPTVTQEPDTDAKIDEENRRPNRATNNICRGC